LITGLKGSALSTAVPVTDATPPPLGGTNANNDPTLTATSVALKSSTNGIPALMMEFSDSVGTRVPIGDVDMVVFCKDNQLTNVYATVLDGTIGGGWFPVFQLNVLVITPPNVYIGTLVTGDGRPVPELSISTGLTYSTSGNPPISTFSIAFVPFTIDAFRVVGNAGLSAKAKKIAVTVYVTPDFSVTVLAAPETLGILRVSTVNPNVDGDVIVVFVFGVIESVVTVSCVFKLSCPPNTSMYLRVVNDEFALNDVIEAALPPLNLITLLTP
jgi:hypothetical protein